MKESKEFFGIMGLSPADFGLQITPPEGWIELVCATVLEIQDFCEENGFSKECVRFDQIKEKFAGLRIYVTLSKELSENQATEVRQIIRKAEEKAYFICQWCGSEEDVRLVESETGWLRRLCTECRIFDRI